MDLLHDVNKSREVIHQIDFKEFYNEAINNEVDLKMHYKTWAICMDGALKNKQPFDKHRHFSLVSYAWILDAANKDAILKRENVHTQQQEINSSLLNIFTNPTGALNMHLVLKVHRTSILEDALRMLIGSSVNLKKQLKI